MSAKRKAGAGFDLIGTITFAIGLILTGIAVLISTEEMATGAWNAGKALHKLSMLTGGIGMMTIGAIFLSASGIIRAISDLRPASEDE